MLVNCNIISGRELVIAYRAVIEHVADPTEFCKSLSSLTVGQGATVISTINRSMRAYATAIVAAEYLLQWIQEMAGFVYNPLSGRWSLSDEIGVNFIAKLMFGVRYTDLQTKKYINHLRKRKDRSKVHFLSILIPFSFSGRPVLTLVVVPHDSFSGRK
ncbi:hypothetical protein POM88_004454 [Heracleum sosnowskyi]|uniref:Uncharacterized protein n=1 Tax=Heracleum sosnowskyi TaxID=360622 RepID=A0AAD8JJW4_9APIA|nr:hypothetical protein POM88_004454 [Heracleum sosnowskyi]